MTVLGPTPSVSVVVNTLDRADALATLLNSLQHLTYPNFEVVVVAGPCRDHTADVVAEWRSEIVARTCPEPNLSMSRNIGIAAAAGHIVAFIDDDAVPECRWLDELVEGYSTDEIAGVGGLVHDHTGFGYQTRFIYSDRLGRSRLVEHAEPDVYCYPGSFEFPSLLGCNSSFRRDRLVEVGGFDEQYDYFLDETDVCVRLIDAGYVIRQLDGAPVHHKFLPSSIRTHHRLVRDYLPVVRNTIYFGLLNAADHRTIGEILEANAQQVVERLADLENSHRRGLLTDDELTVARRRIESAWEPGLAAGFRGRARLYSSTRDQRSGEAIRRFPTLAPNERRLRLAFVSQNLPPATTGGIGRYFGDLAAGLTARGHEVRVITDGDDHPTVDFEVPGWVHRIPKAAQPGARWFPEAPERIEANARAVADELVRVQREIGPFDAVYAPIWDVEGLAVQQSTSAPLITSLQTTMAIALQSRDDWRCDAEFMARVGEPHRRLEIRMAEVSEGLHAYTEAIVAEVEAASSVIVDREGLLIAPLGIPDSGIPTPAHGDGCTILFVGRFERRKGIDLLLESIPSVLEADPETRFVLVGRDDLDDGTGSTYRQRFEFEHRGASWLDRVEFLGEVDEEALRAAYNACDVFVAPSRFESFGLIFVEAMRAARPVVALRAGAAPDVIVHDKTGVLVDVDTSAALAEALIDLAGNPAERVRLGQAGRTRFEEQFTLDAMCAGLEQRFQQVRSWRPGGRGVEPHAPDQAVVLPDGSSGLSAGGAGVRVNGLARGRTTVVVWTAADGGLFTIGNGERRHVVQLVGERFHHVLVPFDTDGELTVSGPGFFAAVHVVTGDAVSVEGSSR